MYTVYQGNIATDGSTKILCTNPSMTINNIVITNPSTPCHLAVSRFMAGNGIHEVPLYNFELNDGDVVTDETLYFLIQGNYIQLISDVPGTSYYITTT